MAGRRPRPRHSGAAAGGSASISRHSGRRGTEAVGNSGTPAAGSGSGHPAAREAPAGHELAAPQGARAVRAGAEQRASSASAVDRRRPWRVQPRSAAQSDPVSRHARVADEPAAAQRHLHLVNRYRRQAADSPELHDGGRSRARTGGPHPRKVAANARGSGATARDAGRPGRGVAALSERDRTGSQGPDHSRAVPRWRHGASHRGRQQRAEHGPAAPGDSAPPHDGSPAHRQRDSQHLHSSERYRAQAVGYRSAVHSTERRNAGGARAKGNRPGAQGTNRSAAVVDADARGTRVHAGAPEMSAFGFTFATMCVLVATLAGAQTPGVVNGTLEPRTVSQTVAQEISALAARLSGPAWVGYAVPLNGRDREAGCWSSDASRGRTRVGPLKLEGSDAIFILLRIADLRLQQIRVASPECPLDAGGLTLYWLTGVRPADSIDWLGTLATGDA